jgi:SAM-dependent methyltransferase
VHELLRNLPKGAIVLDLGCGRGSFESDGLPFTVIRIDLEHQSVPVSNFVQADSSMLPFSANCFQAVISNNSIEHFDNLPGSLEEIRRVLKSSGALYVAAPDATTISDRFYRWLARGGGHVNPFTSKQEVALLIEQATGFRHIATRTLCTSFSFLNSRNRRTRPPRRLLLLGGGAQPSLLIVSYLFRLLDRFFGMRTTVYGWALYFGNINTKIECKTWTNVCVRCGSGHPSEWLLRDRQLVRRLFFLSIYPCPNCGTMNLFTDDRQYTHLAER